MRVYVVEKGCYADRYIVGVYPTAEAAMATNPGRWRGDDEAGWDNGLDWEDAARVIPCEVQTNDESPAEARPPCAQRGRE